MSEPVAPGSVSQNRSIMIVLSYLWLLALVPLLVEKDDREVQWHAKHGIVADGRGDRAVDCHHDRDRHHQYGERGARVRGEPAHDGALARDSRHPRRRHRQGRERRPPAHSWRQRIRVTLLTRRTRLTRTPAGWQAPAGVFLLSDTAAMPTRRRLLRTVVLLVLLGACAVDSSRQPSAQWSHPRSARNGAPLSANRLTAAAQSRHPLPVHADVQPLCRGGPAHARFARRRMAGREAPCEVRSLDEERHDQSPATQLTVRRGVSARLKSGPTRLCPTARPDCSRALHRSRSASG